MRSLSVAGLAVALVAALPGASAPTGPASPGDMKRPAHGAGSGPGTETNRPPPGMIEPGMIEEAKLAALLALSLSAPRPFPRMGR